MVNRAVPSSCLHVDVSGERFARKGQVYDGGVVTVVLRAVIYQDDGVLPLTRVVTLDF